MDQDNYITITFLNAISFKDEALMNHSCLFLKAGHTYDDILEQKENIINTFINVTLPSIHLHYIYYVDEALMDLANTSPKVFPTDEDLIARG